MTDSFGGRALRNSWATSPQMWARIAGVLWLICVASGMFAEAYVRGKLILPHDDAGTIRNILSSEGLYRAGFMLEFAGTAAYLALTAILYLLLAPVDRTVSLIAAFFSVVGCTIWMANMPGDVAPLAFRDALLSGQSQSIAGAVTVLLRIRPESLVSGMLCFGVQCFLVGILVARSTYLPKALGALLALGGVAYVVSATAHFVWPPLALALHGSGYLVGEAGEILLGLWLAIKGLNTAKWASLQAQAAPLAG